MNFNPLTKWVSGAVTTMPISNGSTAYNAGDPINVGELLSFAVADIAANAIAAVAASGGLWAGGKAAGPGRRAVPSTSTRRPRPM